MATTSCPTCAGTKTAPNTPLNRRSGLVCSTCWNTGTVSGQKLTVEADPSHRITRRRETLRGDRPTAKDHR